MAKIHVLTEHDLLLTSVTRGDYYACTDSGKLYKDTSDSILDRRLVVAMMISTENERLYKIKPITGKLYYVWETNELWIYEYGWKLKLSSKRDNSGYIYDNGVLVGVANKATTGSILDNNGLLEDGSVVIRDANRIIKGRLYTNVETNALTISSFIGGGITLLPNGDTNSTGYLKIYNVSEEVKGPNNTVETKTRAIGWFDGEWNTNDDMYVNLDGGFVEPITEPKEHDLLLLATYTERPFISSINGDRYILRNDYKITIDSDLNVSIELILTDNSNAPVSTPVVGPDDSEYIELVNSGTIISKTTMTGTRTIDDSGNLIITTEDGVIITFLSNTFAAEVGNYNVIVNYVNADISDTDDYADGDASEIIETDGQCKVHHRYLLWHEGNFDFDKYITPEKILYVLQQNEPPLELTVTHLGKIDPETGDLLTYTPDDFAPAIHKHLAGVIDNITNIYAEADIIDFDKISYKILKKIIDKGANDGRQQGITVTMPAYGSSRTLEDLYVTFKTNNETFVVRDKGIKSNTVDKEGNQVDSKMGEFTVDLSHATNTINLTISPWGHHHDITQMDGYDELIAKFDTYVPLSDTVKIEPGNLAGKIDAEKLVYTDEDGWIPASIKGTSINTKMLDHPINIVINDLGLDREDKSIGSAQNETFEGNDVNIDIRIEGDGHTHRRYVLAEGIQRDPNTEAIDQAGVTIPTLDNERLIKLEYFHQFMTECVWYSNTFDPNLGYPVCDRTGDFFVASDSGYPDGIASSPYISKGDIIIYLNEEDGWIHIKNGQSIDMTHYAFDDVPCEPGFYIAIPNSDTYPIPTNNDEKWSVLVGKCGDYEYIQYAICSDGKSYVRHVTQETELQDIIGFDEFNNPVVIGNTLVRTGNVTYDSWNSVSDKIITFDVVIDRDEWVDVTEDPEYPLYRNPLNITSLTDNMTVPKIARYNVYSIAHGYQLSQLEEDGVTRIYIINENGIPYIYADMAMPTVDLYLQVEMVPTVYYGEEIKVNSTWGHVFQYRWGDLIYTTWGEV